MDENEVLKESEPMSLAAAMQPIIEQLKCYKKFPAVHTYTSTLHSFLNFAAGFETASGEVTPPTIQEVFRPGTLKEYETWLRSRQSSWNTVSTYQRTLKAVYNRLLQKGLLPYIPRLFDDVYTRVESQTKRALADNQIHTLLAADADRLPPQVQSTLAYFLLTFLLRGMPFIDLAYLQKRDVKGDCITYYRHKTGRQIMVRIPREARELIERFRNPNPDSIYLFPILDAGEKANGKVGRHLKEEQLYKLYLRVLHRFNNQLLKVAALLLPGTKLSSYTPRHTWATLAFHKGVHVGIISKALGHSSIKVTETYLKPFDNEKLDVANSELIACVMGG